MRTSVSLIAIAATLALAGCDAGHQAAIGNATSNAADAAGNFADATGTAISNAAGHVADAVTSTPSAQDFINKAAKSDAFEIASAKLAKTKAASAGVKSFAVMMIEDHTASTAKIKKAAASASPALSPDPALTRAQQDMLDKLGTLKGDDFDKTYASQQVDTHETALSLMKTYADKGEVAPLKTAAGEIAPKVQTHLDRIKAIKKNL